MNRIIAVMATGFIAAVAAAPALADDLNLPRERIELVAPPFLPKHEQATKAGPKIMEVTLTVQEKEMVVDDQGTKLRAMTFNGSIPAPAIVVHQGDYVELTLVNPATNTMPHNIDFHGATGGLGGGDLTLINPGEETVLRFKATRPGAFVYHCIPGGEMIPWHIASGMSGVLLVLPRDGLKDADGKPLHYDTGYYIGEQDMYVPRDEKGNFKTYASHADAFADTIALMRTLTPDFDVFEGKVGALTGKNAIKAKVGENVLVIHSEADLGSDAHLIGGHGDYVWQGGSFTTPPDRDLQGWYVPAGATTVWMYKFLEPGVYAYVNHNMTKAVELGATAHFKVEGPWNNDLMEQVRAPEPIPQQTASANPASTGSVGGGTPRAAAQPAKAAGSQSGPVFFHIFE